MDSVGYQADLARLSALQAKQGNFMGRKKTQAREETTLSLSLCFIGEEAWAQESCV